MNISISEAKTQFDDLVRRAEAGEEVIVTSRGRPVAKLSPIGQPPDMANLPPDLAARRERLLALSSKMALEKKPPADAAHSADFMYDEYGLPG
jgi:prevent-host-death family protein